MKIGIISERLNRPLTGVGTYTYHLIKELSTIHPREDLFLINSTQDRTFTQLATIAISPPAKCIQHKPYLWHLYSQYKLRENDFDLDLIHSPENATLFVKLKSQKKVITLYDIRPYLFSSHDLFTYTRYKLLLGQTLATADKIITISESTKNDLVKHFNISDEKVKMIYIAADRHYQPLDQDKIHQTRLKYKIYYPFILYVGQLTRHKNIVNLIRAFSKVQKNGFKHKLVLTGDEKTCKDKKILLTIRELNLESEVIFIGYIPKEDLPGLYNAADVFVFPSLYEGFGLPPLEAMACGCPVITSNTSSLPEVVGNAGIMIDPHDVTGLANAICDVLTDPDAREYMIKEGLKQAKLFSWERCAKETLDVYHKVM